MPDSSSRVRKDFLVPDFQTPRCCVQIGLNRRKSGLYLTVDRWRSCAGEGLPSQTPPEVLFTGIVDLTEVVGNVLTGSSSMLLLK